MRHAEPVPNPHPGRGLIAGAVLLVVVLSGCGERPPRNWGDTDGDAVVFTVHLDRLIKERATSHQGRLPPRVEEPAVGSPNDDRPPPGYRLGYTTTEARLLIGTRRHDDDLGSEDLSWGRNRFFIPLRAGRSIHLTLQLSGGHQLLEDLGTVQVDGPMQLSIRAGARETLVLRAGDGEADTPPLPDDGSP